MTESGVDLSEAERLDASTLLFCTATLATRVRRHAPAVLRLPHTRAGRDFLREWNVQAAVEIATGVPLRHLVAPEDRHYFGEPGPSELFPPARIEPGLRAVIGRLEADGFFATGTYPLGEPALTVRMIQGEWSRWRRHLFLEGLGPYLRGPQQDVARVVIHELLANAAQHPDARVALVSSTVTDDAHGRPWLLISVWDDGRSIINTLRDCLREDRELRATTPPQLAEAFEIEAIGWERDGTLMESTFQPDSSTPDGDLLVASLIAGISRKPSRTDLTPVPRPEPGDWDDQVGYGLYALYRSVIDDFAGDLRVRTLGYEMCVKAGSTPDYYHAQVHKDVDERELTGNLVTVRLPIFV